MDGVGAAEHDHRHEARPGAPGRAPRARGRGAPRRTRAAPRGPRPKAGRQALLALHAHRAPRASGRTRGTPGRRAHPAPMSTTGESIRCVTSAPRSQAQHVRAPLHDRAELGRPLRPDPRDLADHRHEEVVGLRARPAVATAPWYCCIGAQKGTFAPSMPRLSAARPPPGMTSRSSPSPCRKVAKNGNSPFSWNSSREADHRGRRGARESELASAAMRLGAGAERIGAPSGSFRLRVPWS